MKMIPVNEDTILTSHLSKLALITGDLDFIESASVKSARWLPHADLINLSSHETYSCTKLNKNKNAFQ